MAWKSDYTDEQWAKARLIYETTNDSIRKIAEATGIKAQALESKVRRGDWTRPKQLKEAQLVKKAQVALERKIETKVAQKAEALTERASRLTERTLEEAEEWLDVIKTKRLSGELDADECAKLLNAWKVPIQEARRALRMDEGSQTIKVGLFLPVNEIKDVTNATTIDVETVSSDRLLDERNESSVDGQ
jgi:hypothetical protein